MKKFFCEPELVVEAFEFEDVMTVSGNPNIGEDTEIEWG